MDDEMTPIITAARAVLRDMAEHDQSEYMFCIVPAPIGQPVRQAALFDKNEAPRRPRLKRMRVADAGPGCIQFICPHCGHDTDWIEDEWTLTENKRGLPCPKCN